MARLSYETGGIIMRASAWGSLIAIIVFAIIGFGMVWAQVPPMYAMPVVAVLAVLAIFAIASFIASWFKVVGLADAKEALGLPDGSVRALIALTLIVVFAVMTLFMLTSPTQLCTELASIVRSNPAAGTPAATAVDAIKAKQQSSDDLAKQLLTMLGTLLASVASFYFGSAATASGTAAATKLASPPPTKPQLTAVNVATIPADGQPHPIEVTGTGLAAVDQAKITHGATTIKASDPVTSNPTVVKFSLTVATDINDKGPWDITVSTPDGATATLPGALTIGA